MSLKRGVRKKELKSNNDAEATKIFNRAIEHFIHKKEYIAATVPRQSKKLLELRKVGSDLTFKLTVGDLSHSYLEVYVTDVSATGFSKIVVGTIEYGSNGACVNKRKVCLPNKRQQAELTEVIDQVEQSLRPNSINFIMGD